MGAYQVRRSAFEPQSAFSLEDGALVRRVGGAPVQRIALSEVTRVRLTYTSVMQVDRWVCTVQTARGRIWIPSLSYVSVVARLLDQSGPFRPFIQDLTAAVAAQAAGRPISFVRGDSWSRPVWLTMLIILGSAEALFVAVAVAGLATQGVGALAGLLPPLVALAFFASIAWRIWRRSKPGVFDPNALPDDVARGGDWAPSGKRTADLPGR
jgi:hypothetical protein